MSIPRGAIWQELRALALSAIPAGAKASYSMPNSLSRWQRNGYYVVHASTPSQYTLITAGTDFGTALIGDAEHLLDHAAEHQASIWKVVNEASWFSPAWIVVTFYYWSFFLVLALARMIGETPWFIDGNTNNSLSKLAPAGSRFPGSGTFKINCGQFVSATDREITLKKSGARVHEEAWKNWFGWCSRELQRNPTGTGSQLEQRFYTAIDQCSKKLGPDWPSALRNAVNYKPGLAYDAVRRQQSLGSFSYLRVKIPYEMDALIDRFESLVLASRSPGTDPSQLSNSSEILVCLTFLLHAVTLELYSEVIERRGIDLRWKNRRRQFLLHQGIVEGNNKLWPC